MAKYDISKASDMRRFSQDLKKSVIDNAKKQLQEREFDVTCPHCNVEIKLVPGHRTCPQCGESIDFKLDIND